MQIKKLICQMLILSVGLSACNNNVGSNSGGVNTSQKPMLINSSKDIAVTQNTTTDQSAFETESGAYRFAYSNNFGSFLSASADLRGEFYFTANSIIWLDKDRKIKTLGNINLTDAQLLHRENFVAFIKQNINQFSALYQDASVIKIMNTYTDDNLSSNRLYLQTSKGQLLSFDFTTGALNLVLNNVKDYDYSISTHKIAVLQVIDKQVHLKQIDTFDGKVSDITKIQLENGGTSFNNIDNEFIASAEYNDNNLAVALSQNASFINEDGEQQLITKDSLYKCDVTTNKCVSDSQILTIPSGFQVNNAIPNAVNNLFTEFAKNNSIRISSMSSTLPEQDEGTQINWAKVGVTAGIPVLLTVVGGLIGYHLGKKVIDERVREKIRQFEKVPDLISPSRVEPFLFIPRNEDLIKGLWINKVTGHRFTVELTTEHSIPDTTRLTVRGVNNIKLSNADLNYFIDYIKDCVAQQEDRYNFNTSNKTKIDLRIVEGDSTGLDIDIVNDIIKRATDRDSHQMLQDLFSFDFKFSRDLNKIRDRFFTPAVLIPEELARLEAAQHKLMVKWAGGLGFASLAIEASLYSNYLGQTFNKKVVISEPACTKTQNCSVGTVKDITGKVINDENDKPIIIGSGYIQQGVFNSSDNNAYLLKFYRLSNDMSCSGLDDNYKNHNINNMPGYVEVSTEDVHNTELLPIVDSSGNICNLSNSQTSLMIKKMATVQPM